MRPAFVEPSKQALAANAPIVWARRRIAVSRVESREANVTAGFMCAPLTAANTQTAAPQTKPTPTAPRRPEDTTFTMQAPVPTKTRQKVAKPSTRNLRNGDVGEQSFHAGLDVVAHTTELLER